MKTVAWLSCTEAFVFVAGEYYKKRMYIMGIPANLDSTGLQVPFGTQESFRSSFERGGRYVVLRKSALDGCLDVDLAVRLCSFTRALPNFVKGKRKALPRYL
jgi:hypothetical protein